MATTNQPSGEILAWAKKQAAWRQDALRRILTKPFVKTDEDECLELLKAAHGIATTKLTATPLDANHLPVHSSSATNLRLVTLDDIANVNRLAKDAALSLALDGLTIIYGDNGSGKSGFIRILKKACRARDHESILPDIFANKKANSPASARFTIEEGTTKLASIGWLDDGKPSADALGRFSIFDSKCASVHVDGENRIEVVPHNLDCFERLAHVCDRLRVRLKGKVTRLKCSSRAQCPKLQRGRPRRNLSGRSAGRARRT
jgi:energy-coupling factor transporter ATP-binding protein EcfA2